MTDRIFCCALALAALGCQGPSGSAREPTPDGGEPVRTGSDTVHQSDTTIGNNPPEQRILQCFDAVVTFDVNQAVASTDASGLLILAAGIGSGNEALSEGVYAKFVCKPSPAPERFFCTLQQPKLEIRVGATSAKFSRYAKELPCVSKAAN